MENENNNESQADGKRRRKGTTTGAATAIGVGVGVALYSATDFHAWIAVGAGLALGVGAAMEARSKKLPAHSSTYGRRMMPLMGGFPRLEPEAGHIGWKLKPRHCFDRCEHS